jgi:hypothetical protein
MAGYSLHIGLNKVQRRHIPHLRGCVNDAIAMYELARGLGYQAATLTDEAATYVKVFNHIADKAQRLVAGDIFWITYSGHGSQAIDLDGDEADGLDETWVLYDHQLRDDHLHYLWTKFKFGVRLVVFSDSCHSGTIARSINSLNLYDTDPPCKASGILISGCQDHQVSLDGNHHGVFTAQFLKVWNQGQFLGTYKQLHQAIARGLPKAQNPNYMTFGEPDRKFTRQQALTI